MKKIKQEQKKAEKSIDLWNRFIIISIIVFVFLRFFADGLTYPGYNFIWNIYFFILTIIHLFYKKTETEIDKTGILLLLYFISSVFSTGLSPVKGTGVSFNAQILAYWCMFLLIKENFKTDNTKKALLFTIILSGLFVCVYGLYQYFFGLQETRQFIYSRPELLEMLPSTFLDRISSNRVFSTFVYPNVFASFLLFLIPLSFFYTISKEKLPIKITSGIVLILALWNMFLTGSSGGLYILLMILQIMLLFLLFDTKKLKVILPIIILLEIGFVFGCYRAEKLPKMSSFADRVQYWNSAAAVFKEHPLLGVGAENYKYHYTKHKLPETMEAKHPHSILFAALAETGVVGTFFLFAFLVITAVNLFKKARVSPEAAGISFSFLAFLLHNFIDFNFINPSVALLFFITGGLAVADRGKRDIVSRLSLTKYRNFLIILILILTGIGYIRYSFSLKALYKSNRERDINNRRYDIERAEKLYPQNFEIYEKKGDAFNFLFKIKKEASYQRQAEVLYQQAVSLNPFYTASYRKLALLYEDLGDYEAAEKMYLNFLKLYPNKKQYNIEAAVFYKKRGDEANFNYYYEKSKNLFPVTTEEQKITQDYEKWIESQR